MKTEVTQKKDLIDLIGIFLKKVLKKTQNKNHSGKYSKKLIHSKKYSKKALKVKYLLQKLLDSSEWWL